MKKTVLGSLLLAALTMQSTGCIITTDDDDPPEDFATIDAVWSFHDVNPDGTSLSPSKACPSGYTDVELHMQEVDPVTGRDVAPEIVNVFDCAPGTNFSQPLEPGVYDTFIVVTAEGGAPVYATSFADIVDVTLSDKLFETEIIDNGGYFKLGWDLRDQAAPAVPITCNDLIAGKDRIGVTATLVSNTSIIVADDFDCELGDIFSTFSSPVRLGTYDVAIEPVDSTGASLGPGVVLQDKVMGDRNTISDLGVITLAFP